MLTWKISCNDNIRNEANCVPNNSAYCTVNFLNIAALIFMFGIKGEQGFIHYPVLLQKDTSACYINKVLVVSVLSNSLRLPATRHLKMSKMKLLSAFQLAT